MHQRLRGPCQECPFRRGVATSEAEQSQLAATVFDLEYEHPCHRTTRPGPGPGAQPWEGEEECYGVRLVRRIMKEMTYGPEGNV